LRDSNLDDIDWKELNPDKPFYFFMPQDKDLQSEYEQGWKVNEILPLNVLGFQTHRDYFAVDFDASTLHNRIKEMRNTNLSDDEYRRKYELQDNRDWKLAIARKNLRERKDWQSDLITCAYRPFDFRPIYFSEIAADYPRLEVNKHLRNENLALNFVRQTKAETWEHALASDKPTPAVFLEIKDGSSVFPLYLYTTPEETAGTLFAQTETTRKPNLAPEFIKAVEEKLKLKFNSEFRNQNSEFSPEDIFHYAYAVFHSPTYRKRYAEFLKIDFPRLPITSDKKLFRKLAEKGKALVELHLLKSSQVDDFVTTYPEAGDNKVEKITFEKGKVFINASQFFGKVPAEVWEFKVGGYQVCEKWLKDRKGRTLSGEDITHYQRVVVSLKETIRLMKEIDKSIVKCPLE
jgi:predicted helicase